MKPNAFITKEAGIDRLLHHWMHKQPNCCLWGVIRLDEPLSDEILERSLTILIKMVPILSAKLKKGLWSGFWVFEDPGDIKRLITRKRTPDGQEVLKFLKAAMKNPIDAAKPPVVRVTSIDAPEDHYLVLQIHHTVMDGGGAKRLFDLFAGIYRRIEKDPEWQPAIFPAMDRGWLQIAKHLKWHRFLIAPFVAVKELFLFIYFLVYFRKTATVILGDFPVQNKRSVYGNPQTETFVIGRQDMQTIKSRLSQKGAKVNDLIMAALMTTVNIWNSARGQVFSYVLSPYTIDLRRWWGEPEGSFANLSVFCMAFASREGLGDVHKALRTLKPGFDRAKKEFGLKELWDLLFLQIQPEIISRIATALITGLINATHALTNIGIIPESAGNFGRIKATSYSMIAPFFPGPNLLFSATSYKGDLTIHCNFDGTHVRPETARDFMRQFRDNILSGIKMD